MSITRNRQLSTLGLSFLDRIKGYQTRYYLNLYTKSLQWSRDQIENYQVQRIKNLLISAKSNVVFYKKRFQECGFDPENFIYLDQLKSIPPLTRKDLQDNLSSLISNKYNLAKCKKGSSSGSTGYPVTYYHDSGANSAYKAAVMFFKLLGGYKIGDPWLNIWGNPTAVNIEWKKLSSRISKYVFNEIRFPAYKLNKKEFMDILVTTLFTKKPKFIYGYTNAIYLLAEYLDSKSVKIDFIKGIFTTAENLQDFQRVLIEKNIGKIFDQYGCSEINGIASQILHDDDYYYILDTHVLMEFGDLVDQETGMRKIIVTDFNNYVLPFIRYENGDLATPDYIFDTQIKFSRIKSIDGRLSDIIKLPSGGMLVVPSFFGSRMLKNIIGIKQYQIIKFAPDRIRINLSVNDNLNSDSKTLIDNTLKEYIPKELKFELVFNDKFIYTQNNKFKLFIDTSLQNIQSNNKVTI